MDPKAQLIEKYYKEQTKMKRDMRKSGISIKTDVPLKPIQTEVLSESKPKKINCKLKKNITIDW
jgi:hypothetical protein